jgi:hypothetical protein
MRRGHIRDAGASANPYADLPRYDADGKGENDRRLITRTPKADRSTRHPVSDRVPATPANRTLEIVH